MKNIKSSLLLVFVFSTLVISLFTTVVEAKSFTPQGVRDTKVLGTSDFVTVQAIGQNVPFNYRRLLNAIGFFSIGCTGTHLGSGVVLTAGHCFGATERLSENISCAGHSITWSYREDVAQPPVSNCLRILAMADAPGADFALIQVDNPPRVWVPLDLEQGLQMGQAVTIFSHPNNQTLRWSRVCRLGMTLTSPVSTRFLFHKCDTSPGSSGAALIDTQTLRIVGVHNGDAGDWNYASAIRILPIPFLIGKYGLRLPVNR